MSYGWIKIMRSEADLMKDHKSFAVWSWCLMQAKYEGDDSTDGLPIGALSASISVVSRELDLSVKQVRRCFTILSDRGLIIRDASHKGSVIAIPRLMAKGKAEGKPFMRANACQQSVCAVRSDDEGKAEGKAEKIGVGNITWPSKKPEKSITETGETIQSIDRGKQEGKAEGKPNNELNAYWAEVTRLRLLEEGKQEGKQGGKANSKLEKNSEVMPVAVCNARCHENSPQNEGSAEKSQGSPGNHGTSCHVEMPVKSTVLDEGKQKGKQEGKAVIAETPRVPTVSEYYDASEGKQEGKQEGKASLYKEYKNIRKEHRYITPEDNVYMPPPVPFHMLTKRERANRMAAQRFIAAGYNK